MGKLYSPLDSLLLEFPVGQADPQVHMLWYDLDINGHSLNMESHMRALLFLDHTLAHDVLCFGSTKINDENCFVHADLQLVGLQVGEDGLDVVVSSSRSAPDLITQE